ncbi:YkvA family protein [Emticicia sp. SJ17W-69]|uniref:YkvA family protein n=1 Tax=Emticicia sp. SJ17W-69 TaxID=3421657 RepID=UPI003EBB5844
MSTISSNTKDLLTKILESTFYKIALRKAPRIAKNANGLLKLLRNALQKTQKMGVGGVFDVIREKVTLLGNLIKAYATGEYRQIELPNLLKIIAGFIYFISPIDIIPDFLPYIGLTDDVALLMFIINSIDGELNKFEQWKKAQPIKV